MVWDENLRQGNPGPTSRQPLARSERETKRYSGANAHCDRSPPVCSGPLGRRRGISSSRPATTPPRPLTWLRVNRDCLASTLLGRPIDRADNPTVCVDAAPVPRTVGWPGGNNPRLVSRDRCYSPAQASGRCGDPPPRRQAAPGDSEVRLAGPMGQLLQGAARRVDPGRRVRIRVRPR